MRWIFSLCLLLSLEHTLAAESPIAPIEEVLVTGEHPGPGLWKVSRGEHTLWILGTHAPLPQRLTWRSEEVEWVLTEAQQVIGPYGASISIQGGGDPFAAKGPSLRRLLSRKQYAQWTALKKKYLGADTEIERAMPVTAALLLRSAAFERAGLTSSDLIWRQIYTLTERYQIPVSAAHQVDRAVEWNARRDAARAQRVGVQFLVSTIDTLEADLRAARSRANAWAAGDIDALKDQAANDRELAQLYASSWPFLDKEEVQSLQTATDTRWLAAAEKALKRNRTTFAALPIYLLLSEDGVVRSLRALGYDVEAPAQ